MKDSSLSWVFYRRLLRDAVKPKARPELLDIHAEGKDKVSSAHFAVNENVHGSDGEMLISMAYNELAKEQAMLNQIFGVGITFDFRRPGAVKELIDTLNACLNLKEVYERNKQLITADNGGQKGVFSFFNTYVLQAFDERRDSIKQQIVNKFLARETFFQAVKETLDNEFDNIIIPRAIELMLSANVERGVDEQYKNAYAEVIQAIMAFPNNPLAEGLKRGWGISELINKMSLEIAGATDINSLNKMFNKYEYKKTPNKNGKIVNRRHNTTLRKMIAGSKHYNDQASGLSLEALEDQLFSMVVNGIPNFSLGNRDFQIQGGVEGKVIKGLGYKKMRPDGAVIFNLDGSKIENEINSTPDNDRQAAVDTFNRIGHYVENVKDGFIVYTNAKNYTLNEGFLSRGGYSAGASVNLNMLEGVLGNFVDNVDDLITVLLNAGKGAIAEGNTGEASKVLARAIAFALFDDWDFIGTAKQDMGGNAIHIMNLNGVLIPLSVFLFSLGEAVIQATGKVSAFATAHISPASYNTGNDNVYGMPYWHKAVSFGKENTEITFHFMKSISSFLQF